ncbi:MAG: DUF3010 family protein [Pseudomonadales bacterium]
MRICGVELKGAEAILCLLDYEQGAFNVATCRQRVIAVSNSESAQAMHDFRFAFDKLAEDYKIDQVVILERPQKGKFAGSATSFKLEACLQLSALAVSSLSSVDIKEMYKRNPLNVKPEDLGLKKFQAQAFAVAYAKHNKIIYEA